MPQDSISIWLARLKDGDQAAAQPLWERYYGRLVALAGSRIRASRRAADDAEDVALSAFDSFCRSAASGRFPQLEDRDDLWRVLVTIVARKTIDRSTREQRLKRGGSDVVAVQIDWTTVFSSEPTPDFAAEAAEEFERLLQALNDNVLQSIALWKMEGFTVTEIAARLGCAPRTVERKLRMIRQVWSRPPEEPQ